MVIDMNETPKMGVVPACRIDQADRIQKGEADPLGDIVDRILIGTDHFIIYSVVQGGEPEKAVPVAKGNRTLLSQLLNRDTGDARRHASDHVWLRTRYPADYDCAKTLRAKLGSIAAELANICDIVDSICRSGSLDAGSSASLRTRATEMMARAMELAYEGNEEEAKALLTHLRKNTTKIRDSKNRMRYVGGNLFALVVLLMVWGVVRYNGLLPALVLPGTGATPPSFDVHALDILALGAVGAFFAVSASVSSIRVDHAVSVREMFYTGIVRIPIGVIAAGVAIFLISGDWLLASIDDTLMPWTFLLFGFLAGFSELFVPNALRQVEAASTVAAPTTQT